MSLFLTAPLEVATVHADNLHWGGKRGFPQWIVLHATGGNNSIPWLTSTSPLSNPVSVHRHISKPGKITKLVEDTEQAWHAGFGTVGPIGPNSAVGFNVVSLGVELENWNNGTDPYPQEQLAACADQCVEWWGKYGLLPIVGHAQVDTRKTDPLNFPWDALNKLIVVRIPGIDAVMKAPPLSPEVLAALHTIDNAVDPLIGETP